GLSGAFGWGSAAIGTPTPYARLEGEIVGLAGYDTDDGFYAGEIAAGGVEVGGASNYAGAYKGIEKEICSTTGRHKTGIRLYDVGGGPEIPFLAGARLLGGLYRQDS